MTAAQAAWRGSRSRRAGVRQNHRPDRLPPFLVLRHRIMLEDLTLEDPDLDAAGPVSRVGGRDAVVDIGTQRMQRHPALAIPLLPRDFRTTKTTRTIDADAFGAKPHGRLHGALHGPAERHAALQLLGDGIGDQRGVDLRLADLDDVDDDLGGRDRRNHLAQLVDIGALFADHDTRTRRLDGHAAQGSNGHTVPQSDGLWPVRVRRNLRILCRWEGVCAAHAVYEGRCWVIEHCWHLVRFAIQDEGDDRSSQYWSWKYSLVVRTCL